MGKELIGLTIYDCHECWEWYPADSYGCGSVCGHDSFREKWHIRPQKEIPMDGEKTPIPEWCPKLKKAADNE